VDPTVTMGMVRREKFLPLAEIKSQLTNKQPHNVIYYSDFCSLANNINTRLLIFYAAVCVLISHSSQFCIDV
jgi:hypothetical protein